MGFVSLWFLVLFLPCSLLIYGITPARGKNFVLLLLSLLFYSQLEMFNLFFMLGSVTIDYFLSRLMQYYDNDNNRRRMMLVISLIKNLGIALIAGTGYEMSPNDIPVGLYIFLFSALGYLIDVYKGDEIYEKNYIRFALYCMMFPRIAAGPLFSYNSFRTQLNSRSFTLDRVSRGFSLFVFGFSKRVLLLPTLREFTEELLALFPSQFTVTAAWMTILCVVLCYYYAFSACCDMAQGLGIMFGFTYQSGFDYPLVSSSLSDFLLRFNGSVTSFIRKYVSVQFSADPNGMTSAIFNLLISSTLVGMWYSMNLNGIAWGIYVGVILVLEQCILPRFLKKIPTFFRRLMLWLFVFPSFLLLINPGHGFLPAFAKAAVGLGVSFSGSQELYLISTHWLPLLCALVFAVPILRPLHQVLALPPLNRRQEEFSMTGYRLFQRFGALILTVMLIGLSVLVLM